LNWPNHIVSARSPAEPRDALATARTEVETAKRAVQRAEQRALTAEGRCSAKLLDQLRTAKAETERARTARDETRRQLARKLASAPRAWAILSSVGRLGEMLPASSRAMADWVVPIRSASWRWLSPFFSRRALISNASRMARPAFS